MEKELEVKLREAFKKRGYTQEQVAAAIGTSARAISEVVTGKAKTINREMLVKIINLLEIEDIREILEIVEKKA
ncbi:helix-turn-helix domain-containing protein [Terribacillus saccharophilus]|uniref:HTH cro/C1-type domain-containing protein n=1 Tax=Terribacillus saccharophilus TaxID=361277 RepID=A0ABX4GTD9_9BACI|nr:helix-turn-helix transcriptional regulator [Terribacillus saccharophilus]PAD94383.1 hypothetical protein CHH50_18865 [Terribacillus saccharophilus]PAD98131.1 hypothetical protein CHH48_18980 [Terribacillus saccharophilus]